MKKKSVLTVLFLFAVLFSTKLYPQTKSNLLSPYDNIVSPSWDFYSLNYLSAANAGKGFTGIASDGDIMSVSLNPASMKLSKKYQFYISYNIKTNAEYTPYPWFSTKYSQSHPDMSAGFGYKINDAFQTGLVYSNKRNMNYFFNFTGDPGDIEYNLNQHTLTIPITYEYRMFRFGTNLNLNLNHGSIKGLTSVVIFPDGSFNYGKTNTINFIPDFGIKIIPLKMLSLGLVFTPACEFDNTWKYDTLIDNHTSTSRFPMKISAGFEYRTFGDKLKFTGEYKFEKMSDYDDWKDRNDFNLGLEYYACKNLTLRTGVFSLKNSSSVLYGDDREYDQYYLTLGGSYEYKNFKFNLAVLSSSIIKSTNLSHSIISFGTSCDL